MQTHDSKTAPVSVRENFTDNLGAAPMDTSVSSPNRLAPTNAWEAVTAFLAHIDWMKVFAFALTAVNLAALGYAISKILLACAIGGWAYGLVTAGTTAAYMVFFAAFAVVMVRRHDIHALFSTAMALLCAFLI